MLTHELIFTAGALTELVRRLSSGRDGVRIPCGLSRLSDRWEWLVSGTGSVQAESSVLAVRGTHPEVLADAARAAANRESDATRVILAVGIGPAAGHFAGLVHHNRITTALGVVRVIAPGLPQLSLGSTPHSSTPGSRIRFSRTIGALGESAFDRLQSLRIAVVGCGRTGSLVADHAAAYGIAGLALIDPDVMEPHNLGEMAGELDADLGRPKAAALAERINRRGQGTVVTVVAAPVQSLDALFALKAADVVVSCPDNPAARLATACVAALYLKPILDFGTGIVRGATSPEIGLDVRWLLPGRCVNCVGGVTGGISEPQRLGSLRSLNTWAVGLGFTLLEQFLGGAVRDSVWVQGEVGSGGVPLLTRTTPPLGGDCHVCALSGLGDDGLPSRNAALSGA